jgi:hypothetical protein
VHTVGRSDAYSQRFGRVINRCVLAGFTGGGFARRRKGEAGVVRADPPAAGSMSAGLQAGSIGGSGATAAARLSVVTGWCLTPIVRSLRGSGVSMLFDINCRSDCT